MNIIVPGEPVPKGRPRKGKAGNFYTPRETVEYESRVAWVAKATRETYGDQPVKVSLDFYVSKGSRADADNLAKSCLDALEVAGVYDNDLQVRELHIYLYPDMNPRAEILVEPLTFQPTP